MGKIKYEFLKRYKSDLNGYEDIVKFHQFCTAGNYDAISLDFSKCSYISPDIISILASAIDISKQKHTNFEYIYGTLSSNIRLKNYLNSSGFISYVENKPYEYFGNNAVKLEKFNINQFEDEILLNKHIDNILATSKINMTDNFHLRLFNSIFELYKNAMIHSETKCGIYSCGHYQPKNEKLIFSLYDSGIGIPNKIRNYFKSKTSRKEYDRIGSIESHKLLKWAFESGKFNF
ncbi:hypothetical protein C7380_108142 [Oceanotoga teriensis]|uniref:Histidine kinase/DNA gyrase B/HSP90-like ATPase n=1 Tax=Oceanotoga teriensis TaxID=515440 RepID=A0AA45C6W8_9BACT|nr:hypothetical protein [Oceanotoga teriensis]PWJ93312.1 hypothetical protein C7380_108142 [Oceanotoga teriensis]